MMKRNVESFNKIKLLTRLLADPSYPSAGLSLNPSPAPPVPFPFPFLNLVFLNQELCIAKSIRSFGTSWFALSRFLKMKINNVLTQGRRQCSGSDKSCELSQKVTKRICLFEKNEMATIYFSIKRDRGWGVNR